MPLSAFTTPKTMTHTVGPARRARPTLHRRGVAVALSAAAHLATGCYAAVPVRWNAAPDNREVEVTLDPTETAGLTATLGPRARQVVGRVAGRTDSSLTVSVNSVTRTTGGEESWPGGDVELPSRAVERVTVRRMSAVRTAALIAGVAAASLLAGRLATEASLAGGGRPNTPGRQ